MTSGELPMPAATWTSQAPATTWCPTEWLEHLRAMAPAFVVPESTGTVPGASGEPWVDVACETAQQAAWQLAAITRRGRLHAHRAEHREDAAAIVVSAGGASRGAWCAAVADGAGSAPYSRIGAALAVHAATQRCSSSLESGASLAMALADGARSADTLLRRFAGAVDTPLRSLRTTLLVALSHGGDIGVMHVGDGGAAFLHDDGRVTIPTSGHAGEYSGEVAHFLPDDGAADALLASVHVETSARLAGVLLVTDGIEDPWYPMVRTAPAMFDQLVLGVRDDNADVAGVTQRVRGPILSADSTARMLAAWMTFEKRGENDDRTLFVARQHGVTWPSSR